MKFNGKALAQHTSRTVDIVRDGETYTLTVTALAPGWRTRMQERGFLRFPEAPKKAVMNGNKPLRDRSGTIVMEEDRNDPKFLTELLKETRLNNAMRVSEMLRKDPNFAFEAVQPQGKDPKEWRAYADAVASEIEDPECGFTEDEIDSLYKALEETDTEIDIEGAVNEYLGEE